MNIFVSSVAFGESTINEIEEIALQNDLSVEFSANFEPSADLINQFGSLQIDRLPHNYFPPPEKPFVLNLASQNDDILQLSRKHCEQGIALAAQCRLKYFSAHAGFCLDPTPDALGQKLKQPESIDRNAYWQTFLESCRHLSKLAGRMGVKFLFENNVLSVDNLRSDGVNPLLCVESKEILRVFNEIPGNSLGFLLDTAHLKVSANSLQFSRDQALKDLQSVVSYIHHSDNDGTRDTNEPLTDKYWFFNHLSQFRDIPHVLEVKNQSVTDIKNQISLLKSFLNK